MPAIVKVAKEHTIDAAEHTILEGLNRHRIKTLAKKHCLTQAEISAGKRRGCVICAEDYDIGSMDNYGDWAEYQYDVRGQEVYYMPLSGIYPKSIINAGPFKQLTEFVPKKD